MGVPVIQTSSVDLQDRTTSGSTSGPELQAEQFDSFFELSPDLFCIATFDGHFLSLNRAWATLGFSRETLLKMRWCELVHPEDRDLPMAEAEGNGNRAVTVSFENRCRCNDGSYRLFHWNASLNPDQRLIYATGRDITDRKQADRALRQSRIELETRVQERNGELVRNNAILLGEIGRCRQMEKSLLETQQRYRSIFENAVEGIFQSTPDGTYISVNPALARIKGYDSPAELMAGGAISADRVMWIRTGGSNSSRYWNNLAWSTLSNMRSSGKTASACGYRRMLGRCATYRERWPTTRGRLKT
jgi:PAS domain S-box-containing protein